MWKRQNQQLSTNFLFPTAHLKYKYQLLCNVDYCLLLIPHSADMAVEAKWYYIALEFLYAIIILL
jgi:hypothetical protein